MSQSALRILILARDHEPRIRKVLDEMLQELEPRAGIEVVQILNMDTVEEQPRSFENIDLAVVLGGDGALLRACRLFGHSQIPILGVNLGRLGFLAELMASDVQELAAELEARRFQVVSHLMLECVHHKRSGSQQAYLGLNEAAILSGASLALIDISLEIDGESVTTFSGDGLIISTPVGSTAHNLSAGGPILRQDLNAFVVTPICPHTLTIRPIVDSAAAEYVLKAEHVPEGVMLVVDGQTRVPFEPGDRAVIRAAPVSFQLVRLGGRSFYRTLHRKLGWHGQPRYQRGRDEGSPP